MAARRPWGPSDCRAAFILMMAVTVTGCGHGQTSLDHFASQGVLIRYTVTHHCQEMITASGYREKGPFVVITIDTIENTGWDAGNFQFETARLFVPSDPKGVPYPERSGSMTVNAGESLTGVGRLELGVPPNDFPAQGVGLRYERRSGDPPVLLLASPRRAPIVVLETCSQEDLPRLRELP
jgi:hypothetical protein